MKNRRYVATCYFLDVGQGASQVILLGGGRAIIIDTGIKREAFKSPLITLLKKELKIQTIEALILSHNDNDHVGDAVTLFDEYQQNIKEVYYLVDRDNDQNQSYRIAMSAVEKEYLSESDLYRLETGKSKNIFSEGQLFVSVLFPNFYTNQNKQGNDTCAIVALEVGTQKIIFSGDAPIVAWKSIVRDNGKVRTQILTVPHHGGKFNNNEDDATWFFENIKIDHAIVSSGYNNRYGHPKKDTISSFVQNDVEIFCTQSNPTCCGLFRDNKTCCGTIVADISTDRIDIKNIERLRQIKAQFPQGMCK